MSSTCKIYTLPNEAKPWFGKWWVRPKLVLEIPKEAKVIHQWFVNNKVIYEPMQEVSKRTIVKLYDDVVKALNIVKAGDTSIDPFEFVPFPLFSKDPEGNIKIYQEALECIKTQLEDDIFVDSDELPEFNFDENFLFYVMTSENMEDDK